MYQLANYNSTLVNYLRLKPTPIQLENPSMLDQIYAFISPTKTLTIFHQFHPTAYSSDVLSMSNKKSSKIDCITTKTTSFKYFEFD